MKRTLLTLGVLLISSSSWAVPTVNVVSGTVTHGQTITISGAGFGTKLYAPPTVWDDCSTGSVPTDAGWDGYWPTKPSPYPTGSGSDAHMRYATPAEITAEKLRAGDDSIGMALPHNYTTRYLAGRSGGVGSSAGTGWNVMFWKNFTIGTNYPRYAYMSWYQRADSNFNFEKLIGAPDRNFKFWDYSTGNRPYTMSSASQNNWYLAYNANGPINLSWLGEIVFGDDTVTYGSRSIQVPDQNGHGAYWPSGTGGHIDVNPMGEWAKYEMELSMSPQSTQGYVKLWENGKLKMNYVGYTDTWSTSVPRTISIGGFSRWADHAGAERDWRYFADIYFDFSRARAMICDNPTWDNGTLESSHGNCEMLIPSAWSETSISARINQGKHPDYSERFLYVVDSSGQVNANGFPVTLGQSQSDTIAPTLSILSPTGTLSADTTTTTVSVTTNEPATCAVASAAGVAHASKTPLTTTGGTNHSYSLSGLQNGQAYTRYISCQDAAGNISADELVFFSVANGDSTPSPDLSCSSSWNLR